MDLGVDFEAVQKVLDRLEQIYQRIIAVEGAIDRLIGVLGCQNDARLESKEGTYGE